MSHLPALPVDAAIPELRAALSEARSAVLQAPPGAGKTTRVPLALLQEPWLAGRRILMLEPRRLATRAAARRLAQTLDERIGETVGYRVRHESRVGPRTAVEVVTEGILTRRLVHDPALEDVGLVVFDEFHERSIHADTGLALTLYSREVLRQDLRVLVMSATLDGAATSALMGGAPIVSSEGQVWPVTTHYRPPRAESRLEDAVAAAVREVVAEVAGDVLVFLPGAGEIRRTAARLEGLDADVIPLHGNLPPEAQDRAILPGASRRKVVLATSIAETSLTIEGVRAVVDSGWARVPRYSPATGMTTLATVRVSQASADQRRGRAGRVGPGLCVRLWSEQQHRSLLPRPSPEILEADLASLALDLAAAGIVSPGELRWLDPPPGPTFAEARSLLGQLGALDDQGRITPHGLAMAQRSLHPRLAHMVLRGNELGAGAAACEIAALLTERDVLRRTQGVPDADIRTRLDLLRGRIQRDDLDREALRRARVEAGQCRSGLPKSSGAPEAVGEGLLLALAYPDRVAQQRPGQAGRYLLRNGIGAVLEPQGLSGQEFLAVAEVEGAGRDGRIVLAAPLTREELEQGLGDAITREEVVLWDAAAGMVLARRRDRLGALMLRESATPGVDPDRVTSAFLRGITESGLEALPWTPAARSLQARAAFLGRLEPGWPDLSDRGLLARLEDWLGPAVVGMRRLSDLGRLDLAALLSRELGGKRAAMLEELAPSHLTVPSGSRLPLDYSGPEGPILAVRLQEVFGWRETPRVAAGRVPVTLHLLSPASRPVQVTRDLAGFWRTTYFEVRKDLRGRYPRHYWPDDPLEAEPTRRAKPRGKPGNRE